MLNTSPKPVNNNAVGHTSRKMSDPSHQNTSLLVLKSTYTYCYDIIALNGLANHEQLND
ncbi:hypothetical protein [Streptococcus dysgalactiae]|uniref:Uncharacterized protein n=1 Tax=Streptococcus dysgalactiae subsp. equisimilis TaxID=119602 RepID=A0A9X8SYU5_STREQ|nr:hypothetical protein [Streptococcus dysgalactiae]EGR88366.1 hypothetical protein HMPREF9963_0487 [Streptococcus dysgalactiae subsp. equisimilis SK1250]CRH91659.1 Uncharacterised protein [Chlamydia trachomatis]VUC95798.1 Uncharacterised protein [Streptococcus sp. NCTC 11567]MBM6534100.1 hypothetical protein [Streptococcus dysgalactiae subsp. equisimilis]MCY7220076.1 hypothetical protein [Streptococcus dysgalactiae]